MVRERITRAAIDSLESRRLLALSGWWKLNESAGATAFDSSGNSFAGAFIDLPTWQTGVNGGALRFDGTNDALSTSASIVTGNQITVAFWFRADALKNQTPLDKTATGTGGAGWSIKLRDDGSISFRVGSGSVFTDTTFPNAYIVNNWVHVGATFANGTAKLFTNGALRATATGIVQSVAEASSTIRFGTPAAVAINESFGGMMDDVRIYDTEVSAADIAAIATKDADLPAAVAALPSITQQQALKKTMLTWALSDATASEAAGLTRFALDTRDDVRNLLNSSIGNAQSAPQNLLPTIPNFGTNPLATSAVNNLTSLRNSTTTYTKSNTDFTPTVATQGLEMAWGFTHPQSPYKGNSTLLTGMLRRFQKTFESNLGGVYTGDFGTAESAAEMYLLLRTVYPDLILPSRKLQWESAIRANADKIDLDNGPRFRAATPGTSWVNADVRWAAALRYSYEVLGTPGYLNTSNSALNMIAGSLMPDGGFMYDKMQNDVYTYHGPIIQALARMWQISGDALPHDLIVQSYWYYPLSIEPNGTAEYSTAASWKHYWNQVTGSEAAYIVADLANSPENLRVAKWSTPTPSLFLSTFYRNDLIASASPDNYIAYDRNIMGPRGRFGAFSFAGTAAPYTGENRGKSTFVGAMVNDFTGTNNGWRLNAAFDAAQSRVRFRLGADENTTGNDVSGPSPVVYYDAAQQEKNSYIVNSSFAAVSSDYRLSKYKGTAQNWKGEQQWIYTPQRIVGLVSVESLVNQTAYSMVGSLRFVSGRSTWGTQKAFSQTGADTWTYGKLTTRVIDQNYGTANVTYEDTWDDDGTVIDNKAGRLNLVDAQAAGSNETTLISYPQGTRRYYLVEIRPNTTTASAESIVQIAPGNGLRGFDMLAGSTQLRSLSNPTDSAITYTFTLPWAGGAVIHRAGEQNRPDFLNAFDQPDTDVRGRTLTPTLPIAKSTNTLTLTIPAHQNVVLERWLPGDVDNNGRVEFSDLLIIAQNYGRTGMSWSQGDVDPSNDGVVGFDDLLVLSQYFGQTLTVVAPTTGRDTRARQSRLSDIIA